MQRYLRTLVGLGPVRKMLSACDGTKLGSGALNRISLRSAVFPTVEDAWAAARSLKHAGHEHPLAIEIHMRFAEKPRPSDYPALFWLSRLGTDRPRIFDFGGNVGNLYYCYKPYLPPFRRSTGPFSIFPACWSRARRLRGSVASGTCGLLTGWRTRPAATFSWRRDRCTTGSIRLRTCFNS